MTYRAVPSTELPFHQNTYIKIRTWTNWGNRILIGSLTRANRYTIPKLVASLRHKFSKELTKPCFKDPFISNNSTHMDQERGGGGSLKKEFWGKELLCVCPFLPPGEKVPVGPCQQLPSSLQLWVQTHIWVKPENRMERTMGQSPRSRGGESWLPHGVGLYSGLEVGCDWLGAPLNSAQGELAGG